MDGYLQLAGALDSGEEPAVFCDKPSQAMQFLGEKRRVLAMRSRWAIADKFPAHRRHCALSPSPASAGAQQMQRSKTRWRRERRAVRPVQTLPANLAGPPPPAPTGMRPAMFLVPVAEYGARRRLPRNNCRDNSPRSRESPMLFHPQHRFVMAWVRFRFGAIKLLLRQRSSCRQCSSVSKFPIDLKSGEWHLFQRQRHGPDAIPARRARRSAWLWAGFRIPLRCQQGERMCVHLSRGSEPLHSE